MIINRSLTIIDHFRILKEGKKTHLARCRAVSVVFPLDGRMAFIPLGSSGGWTSAGFSGNSANWTVDAAPNRLTEVKALRAFVVEFSEVLVVAESIEDGNP